MVASSVIAAPQILFTRAMSNLTDSAVSSLTKTMSLNPPRGAAPAGCIDGGVCKRSRNASPEGMDGRSSRMPSYGACTLSTRKRLRLDAALEPPDYIYAGVAASAGTVEGCTGPAAEAGFARLGSWYDPVELIAVSEPPLPPACPPELPPQPLPW